MERAARLIKNHKASRELLTDGELARAVWRTAVGKSIAAHTVCTNLVRRTLIVEVEDAVWQKQLHSLSAQIVNRVRKLTGSDAVQDVEFRIGVARRPPQAAATRERTSAQNDESDSIQDDVLRKVYLRSRKRASA